MAQPVWAWHVYGTPLIPEYRRPIRITSLSLQPIKPAPELPFALDSHRAILIRGALLAGSFISGQSKGLSYSALPQTPPGSSSTGRGSRGSAWPKACAPQGRTARRFHPSCACRSQRHGEDLGQFTRHLSEDSAFFPRTSPSIHRPQGPGPSASSRSVQAVLFILSL